MSLKDYFFKLWLPFCFAEQNPLGNLDGQSI